MTNPPSPAFDDDNLFDVDAPRTSAPIEDPDELFGDDPAWPAPVAVMPSARQASVPLDASARRDLKAAQKRLGDALPIEGWLAEFVKLAIPMTSSPTEFHLAAGLNALAVALGNRVKTRNWGQNIYPHLWTMVVAPSGNWHKTTAMNMAEELLVKTGLDVMLPNDVSRESALSEYSKKPAGLMVFGEFGQFLQIARKDYGQGLLADLTHLYDGRDIWKRVLRKESFTIRRPAISLYAATTIDWLEELVTPADLRSGFYYRFLFVTAAQKNTNRKFSGEVDQVAQNRLIGGLHRIAEAAPAIEPTSEKATAATVTIAPDALAMWEAWTDQLEAEAESGHHPSYLTGFLQRLQTYGLKLGMIYRASACAFDRSANPLLVDVDAMKAAIAYCKLVWGNTAHLFEEDFASTKEAQDLRRVREAIGKGCSRSEALRRTHMKAWGFDQNLSTLIQTGEIVSEEKTTAALGLNRERVRPIQWLEPGPNHPAVLAKFRRNPQSVADEALAALAAAQAQRASPDSGSADAAASDDAPTAA
jgi:hypothetical protein